MTKFLMQTSPFHRMIASLILFNLAPIFGSFSPMAQIVLATAAGIIVGSLSGQLAALQRENK